MRGDDLDSLVRAVGLARVSQQPIIGKIFDPSRHGWGMLVTAASESSQFCRCGPRSLFLRT
jgi:hypothetical protein